MRTYLQKKLTEIMHQSHTGTSAFRKVLIAVAGLLCVAVVFQAGWNRYTAMTQELDSQIELKELQLERQLRIIEQSRFYREKNQKMKELQNNVVQNKMLQGDTPALAEAKLQNLVNDLAQKTKVNILSMRMLPRKMENTFSILRIGINGRAEIGSIKNFLRAMAHENTYMQVHELDIKIMNRREQRYFNISTQITALAHI